MENTDKRPETGHFRSQALFHADGVQRQPSLQIVHRRHRQLTAIQQGFAVLTVQQADLSIHPQFRVEGGQPPGGHLCLGAAQVSLGVKELPVQVAQGHGVPVHHHQPSHTGPG